MSQYRSDSVAYFRILLPNESAWEIMNKLGQRKLVHLVPSGLPLLSKPFLQQLRRCDEALNKMETFDSILKGKRIYTATYELQPESYNELYRLWEMQYSKSPGHSVALLNEYINQVDSSWNYYSALSQRAEQLANKLQFYRENIAIIRAGEKAFGRSIFTRNEQRTSELGHQLLQTDVRVHFRCGVIMLEEETRFKKTIFRITKGNSLVNCIPFSTIFDNLLDNEKTKAVFFVLFPGRQESYFESKVTRLVDNFSNKHYELPNSEEGFDPQLKEIEKAFLETESLLHLSEEQLRAYLYKFCGPLQESHLFRKHECLKLYLMKERQLYANFNEMEQSTNIVQGSLYVRTEDIAELQQILNSIEKDMKLPTGQLLSEKADRFPTHFVENQFTLSAQEIVQTYGVPRYKEANPAFFTAITFPFLFGVMFGDIAHGLLLFIFGLYLIQGKHRLLATPLKVLVPHRYLFALMGFFAIFCGFIYNDFMSISLNLFQSCYDVKKVLQGQPIPKTSEMCVYPFGLDPVWSIAQNNLNYMNSLKMKIAVIIGVVHMTLGVLIKASNSIHFCQCLDLIFEFLPQLTFLVLLFGYMDFLIVYKWLTSWGYYNSHAPSIITTMINLPLKLGHTDNCCGGQPMWGSYGTTTQDQYQRYFLIAALICIPLMLIPKPFFLIMCHKSDYKKLEDEKADKELRDDIVMMSDHAATDIDTDIVAVKTAPVKNQHDSGEIVVHQLIETIEYALGCISNTASYLRLWALSLAHSQLSDVFFEKTVETSIGKGYTGIPGMLIGFFLLSGITFGVLLCMDSMECFLHTLRLHWVEFQNKFYKGDGFSFNHFSFTKKISAELLAKA